MRQDFMPVAHCLATWSVGLEHTLLLRTRTSQRTPAPLSLRTTYGVEPARYIQITESLCCGARCCNWVSTGNESRGAEPDRSSPIYARPCIWIFREHTFRNRPK